MLSVKEVANELNVTTRTVRNWIENGRLKAYRFGNQFRIESEELENFKQISSIKKGV